MLKVTLIEAIFERDVSTFLNMNPRYIINWKEHKVKGEPAYDGGKTPRWNQSHEFEVGNDLSSAGVMTFTFLDEDDFICNCEVGIKKLVDGKGFDHFYPCRHEGEDSG